jgi:NAD(P)-dependent dehydrogenase (short-subunit alcohol dehydrogenase family)
MPSPEHSNALIVGAGPGLGASLARRFSREGMRVAAAARDSRRLASLLAETDVSTFACDAADCAQVKQLFEMVEAQIGSPDVVVYNSGSRVRGPLVELSAADVRDSLDATAMGAFFVAQEAVRRMLPRKFGAVLFTGASASVKGFAESAPFAMGKFALRGLAQSMARELSPKGIHVAHFVIDGVIRVPGRIEDPAKPDSMLDPDAIADSYVHILNQPRSSWAWEIELRPWGESF